MQDIVSKLKIINEEISETEIFLEYGVISLAFYELKEYSNIIYEINRERENFDELQKRQSFVPLYLKVFLEQKRKLQAILRNIETRTLIIKPAITAEDMKRFLKDSWIYKDDISLQENLFLYAETRLKKAIHETNEELYILKNHPSIFYNKKSSYIGGDFSYRYENEIIIYKKVHAACDGNHHFIVYSNSQNTLSNQRVLLNILAFLNGCPNFEFLSNPSLNKKLHDLYQQFDLLDALRLRNPNYLKSDSNKAIYLELPIIKNTNNYKLIIFKDMPHEGILDLYHASLKQFEPLPRCIFLYRVFEYAVTNHYQPVFTPSNYQPADALNYYLNEALKYNSNPLYYIDFGKENQKVRLNNFFTVLKREAKKIIVEWSNNPVLQNKSRGEIIYLTGRNFTTHGGNGARNMQYDYDKNYVHINNINIVLELIARYLVELLNPQLKNVVERRTYFYKEKYKELFDRQLLQ